MIWHQLYMERPSEQLSARITFSNLPYVSDRESRTDEPFCSDFPLFISILRVEYSSLAIVAANEFRSRDFGLIQSATNSQWVASASEIQ